MGLIDKGLGLVFGDGRNMLAQTAEVFRVNAEAQAGREADAQAQALAQFGKEFLAGRRSGFDRTIDGLNRLPRPAMALGTLGLFVAAMVDPIWFAERMTGIALVPEPLWWLLAAIVSFYFGARHQSKGQEFQREIAATLAAAPQVAARIGTLRRMRSRAGEAGAAQAEDDAVEIDAAPETASAPVVPEVSPAVPLPDRSPSDFPDNAALAEWARARGTGR